MAMVLATPPGEASCRQMDIEERHRDIETWHGLTVRTCEGAVLGVVVGVFVQGPLAGWLRVHGDYRRWTSWTG